jgi:hypothetical protein
LIGCGTKTALRLVRIGGTHLMALIYCPECGHEISNAAVACPNCGRPISATPVVEHDVLVADTRHRREGFPTWAFIPIGILAGVFLLILFIVWGRSDYEDEANQRIRVNLEQQRQTASSRPTTSSEVPSTVTVPSAGTSTSEIQTPPSTATVPGSQTTVAAPPTKGKVVIDAKLSARNGSTQAVKNERFYLLDKDIETVLSEAGVQPIEGQTLTNSLGLSLMYPERYSDFSRSALAALKRHVKYAGRTDGSGKAELGGVVPDSYYLFGMAKAGQGFAIWSSPVSIQPGDNILNLSPQPITELQDSAG